MRVVYQYTIKEYQHKLSEKRFETKILKFWNVVGALVRPNNKTKNLQWLSCVWMAVLWLFASRIRIWWYLERRSNFERYVRYVIRLRVIPLRGLETCYVLWRCLTSGNSHIISMSRLSFSQGQSEPQTRSYLVGLCHFATFPRPVFQSSTYECSGIGKGVLLSGWNLRARWSCGPLFILVARWRSPKKTFANSCRKGAKACLLLSNTSRRSELFVDTAILYRCTKTTWPPFVTRLFILSDERTLIEESLVPCNSHNLLKFITTSVNTQYQVNVRQRQ